MICADFNPGLALKQRQDASTKKQIESSSRTFDALLTTFDFFMIPLYIMLFFERADGLFCLILSVCCFCHQSERVPGGIRATACSFSWHVPYRFVIACSLLSIMASSLLRAASATFIGELAIDSLANASGRNLTLLQIIINGVSSLRYAATKTLIRHGTMSLTFQISPQHFSIAPLNLPLQPPLHQHPRPNQPLTPPPLSQAYPQRQLRSGQPYH